jgi:signal transduction histidine kinase
LSATPFLPKWHQALPTNYVPENESRRSSYAELIAALKAEVQQLNKMVSEFLTIGRPSRLKKARFPLVELFEQVHVLVKQQVISKRIRLSFSGETSREINADIEQMRLVYLNLFLNAIEAVPENGSISCSVEPSAENHVLITIMDNGPGIAPENIERIFEPYFSKRPGGTGLGLALARRIIEEHEGSIVARNRPETGALFEILLPLDIQETTAPGETATLVAKQ